MGHHSRPYGFHPSGVSRFCISPDIKGDHDLMRIQRTEGPGGGLEEISKSPLGQFSINKHGRTRGSMRQLGSSRKMERTPRTDIGIERSSPGRERRYAHAGLPGGGHVRGQAEGNRTRLIMKENSRNNNQRMKQGREAKKDSRVISGWVESVLFSPSPGVPQERVEKKLLSKHVINNKQFTRVGPHRVGREREGAPLSPDCVPALDIVLRAEAHWRYSKIVKPHNCAGNS
jgi:hypothetical protein